MGLRIDTFSNLTGGETLFKALGHPSVPARVAELVRDLDAAGPVALYDPWGEFAAFQALYGLGGLELAAAYVQDVTRVGRPLAGRPAEPVTALADRGRSAGAVLVAAFDAGRPIDQIRHLVPPGARIESFDRLRLPDHLLAKPKHYLDRLNFATNFAFFRDADGSHTRVVTANYWSGYGSAAITLGLTLFDADGAVLADWVDGGPPAGASLVIDSREVRRRFGLGPFTGSLFLHIHGAAGHEVVKYALDTFGDAPQHELSCTHDANAWPAALYAGLPAPRDDERVVLWVQNSHPCAIPAGGIGLNRMGEDLVAWYNQEIPPFGTRALDVGALLPGLRWPDQVEVQAGKYFVRPRYEIWREPAADGRRRSRIAHANVERTDLAPDLDLETHAPLLGKGQLLPAPILPVGRYRTWILPTPMSTAQHHLPIRALFYDAAGRPIGEHLFGNLARSQSVAIEASALVADALGRADPDYGHLELIYDFEAGDCADGWLHAIFRYEDRVTGHVAETSFGSHIFNTALVYRNEPQSYAGRPPGLTTRLFLRLGPAPIDTVCHLIYPASTPWHPRSQTVLSLISGDAGAEVARETREIPCGGSVRFRFSELYDPSTRAAAGPPPYILVRDTSCRLFGYHGCLAGGEAFSFDHMFGF